MNMHETANLLGYCCPMTMMEALIGQDPKLVWSGLGIPPSTFRRWKAAYRRRELGCKERLRCTRRSKELPDSS